MSQYDYGVIDPQETSGVELADYLTQHKAAVHTTHSGPIRPAYVQPGMCWLSTASDPWRLLLWDGNADIPLAEFNIANDGPIFQWGPELAVASAGTVNLAAVKSNRVLVTGTSPIASFGTAAIGVYRLVRFAAALQMTHNATSLILPGGTSKLTAAGDLMMIVSEGSGNWRVFMYQSATGGGVPIGTICPTAASAVPQGWLFCYGQNVLRDTYATLFAAIGTAFGVGNGTTTFTIPDLRGRAIFGRDDMGGAAANRLTTFSGISGNVLGGAGGHEALQHHGHVGSSSTPTFSGNALPSHSHSHGISGGSGLTGLAGGGFGAWGFTGGGASDQVSIGTNTGSASSGTPSGSVSTPTIGITNTGAGSSQNIPPALVTNYMIFAGA